MKYKNFPKEFWDLLSKSLDQELKSNSRPVAAFDADGTLWNTDLGEGFFKWQIENSNLPNLPSDPWKYYRDWKESGDPRAAYLWLAQINQGQKFSQVQSWAEQAVKDQHPLPIFPEQDKLIRFLMAKKVQVFIVTASVKWAVDPGAQKLGVSADHVLGIRTEIENDRVTDQQSGVITYREGKPAALLEVTGGRKPFFCCGNTMGDFALLESATRLRLAVGASKEGEELFQTEEQLRVEAKNRDWLIHKF
jgi:HAD superfamily phosphoserine phosphatase-like hydrolase